MNLKGPAIKAWRAILEERLVSLESSKDDARSGTRVDGEHRPSNRGERAAVTSQGYLAHGLGQRALEIQEHLDQLDDMGEDTRDQVVTGALLRLRLDEGPETRIAIFPGGDASTIEVHGQPIQILSARSPIARQMRDSEAGDVIEIELGGRIAALELIAIE
jgi:transcription elongation GreA/GreB family factor